MPPPASIMTGVSARHLAAIHSVWPVNAMPARLMAALCAGPVVMASNSPARQASTAASMQPTTYWLLPGSRRPGDTGIGQLR